MKRAAVVIFSLLLIASCSGGKISADKVKTDSGYVSGIKADSGRVMAFLGIPFAAPPLGNLRWKDPRPATPWKGILKADKFASAPVQISYSSGKPVLVGSEDCLYLNVWTSAKTVRDSLPVMVWIYGGGFSGGKTSVPDYNGCTLAEKGVVVVSIAYRVGVLGFLALPELSAESADGVSGNYGILDQIAALDWVKNNIVGFGGNPDEITIFGESAGAMSVSLLCASPLCAGFFQRAIAQSGALLFPVDTVRRLSGMLNLKSAEKYGSAFKKRMGAASLEDLRKMPVSKLCDAGSSSMGAFWPCVDGHVVPDGLSGLYESGKYNKVDMIIGTNSDEGATFSRSMTGRDYKNYLKLMFGDKACRISNEYPVKPDGDAYFAVSDIFRDYGFAWPSYEWARSLIRNGERRVFMYYFDQPAGSVHAGKTKIRGAVHGAEIPFVFGTLGASATRDDSILSSIMSDYWVNFARTGDPNALDVPEWPPFDDKEPAALQIRENDIIPVMIPNKDKMDFWDGIFKRR